MKLRVIAAALLLAPCAWTQDDVHITPRSLPQAKTEATNRPLMRVNVDLVLVPVAVTKPGGLPQTGLQKAHFRVWYGGEEQEVKYFSEDDTPVSIGIIIDRSGSMAWKLEPAKAVLKAFADQSNPQDEAFLITFADTIDSTGFLKLEELDGRLLLAQSQGKTSLLDAVYLGMAKMRDAKYQRRALVVVSDGGDNHSRYTRQEIKRMAQEADVQVFAIGLFDPVCLLPPVMMDGKTTTNCAQEEMDGPLLLEELVESGGGTGLSVTNMRDVPGAAARIGMVIRQEYLLGFSPRLKDASGGVKFHKLKVKLQRLPKGLPPLHVDTRQGVYAGK